MALAGLHDQTVRVSVVQDKAAVSAQRMERQEQRLAQTQTRSSQGATSAAKLRAAAIKEEDRAWQDLERSMRRAEQTRGRSSFFGGRGGGKGGSLFGHPTSNFGGLDFGRAGIRPRTAGLFGIAPAAVAGLIKPLTDVVGLLGAVPATAGAATIAIVAFHALGGKAIAKAAADQAKAQEKFKAGTITQTAYAKAMKNALVGLSNEQKAVLPFYNQWHDVVLKVSESIQRRMLPSLRDLGAGLKSIKPDIIGAFGKGAGSLGGLISGAGAFLQTRRGGAGAGALASSSANMLSGFSSASLNLFKSFLDIARAARPLVNTLADDMTRATARFAAFTGSFRGQQSMRQWFIDSEVAAKKFLAVIGNVGKALMNIGGGVGSGFLDWLVQVTDRFEKWTSNQQNVDKLAAALKRMADTLLVIGQAAGSAATHLAKFADFATKTLGPNTIGWLMLGKAAGGGAVLKGLTSGLVARGAAGAAGGAAAGAGGGALAGIGLSGAAIASTVAAAAALGGIIVYLSLKTGDLADQWKKVADATKRAQIVAGGVKTANDAQRARAANATQLTRSVPSAKLALFDAKTQLAGDKSALAGLKGKDRERMLIQIEVDTSAVKQAEQDLNDLRASVKEARAETQRHGDDSREAGRLVADSANAEVNSLERATDASAKLNAAWARQRGTSNKVADATKDFIAKMQEAASKLGTTNARAANYASTAATLAKNLGRIPSPKEVNLTIKGMDSALFNIDRLKGMLLSIKDKKVRVSVITSVGSINPGGAHGGTGGADGDPKTPQYAGGKISSPTVLVGEQAPVHPEFVIATNPAYRARNQKLMGQAAKAMGGEVNFFAQGGVMSGGSSTPTTGGGSVPNRLPPGRTDPAAGIMAALGLANAYGAGDQNAAGLAAAARYAAIPGRIGSLKHAMASLRNQIKREDTWLEHEDDLLVKMRHQMTAEKDKGKKAKLKSQIDKIVHDTIPAHKARRKGYQGKVKDDQKLIDALTAELQDLVPGEAAFQDLIATIEGQAAAASEMGRPDLAKALGSKEIADYQKRIAFLTAFTRVPSTTKNKTLFAAASAALGSDKQALDSLRQASGEDTSGGGGGSTTTDNGDKDQALAMLAELAQWARQGQLSDLIGADQLGVAMDFISKTVGSFAKGSPFIAKGGLAQVHYGEAIVPAWQNNKAQGPMEASLKIEGSDELTRALAKALGGEVNIQLGREARRRVREGASR